MTEQIDLESLERDSYRTTWSDGLLDLCAGVGLAGMGALWLTEHAGLGGVVPALAIPLWMAARKSISEPRSGYFRPNEERRRKIRFGLAGVLVLGVVMLGLGLTLYVARTGDAGGGIAAARIVRGLPAILLALLAGLSGAVFGIPRMPAYAVVLLVSGGVCVWQELHPGWPMLMSGLVVTATGVVLVWRFLRRYPLPREAS